MFHSGGCHCGNITVRLRLSKPPGEMPLRSCSCSFCRAHGTRTLSDRDGQAEIDASDWSLVERYRFGSRTADYMLCRRCGVYVGAVCDTSSGLRCVLNVNCLEDRAAFSQRRRRRTTTARRPMRGWSGERRTGCRRWCARAPDRLQCRAWSYRWQATSRSCIGTSAGSCWPQTGIACGQRGWKRQPDGGFSGLGTSPCRMISSRRSSGWLGSAAENSACGVRMLRRPRERLRVAHLDDLAEIHHHDRVAHMRHRGEVMGDEQIRQPQLAPAGRAAGSGSARGSTRPAPTPARPARSASATAPSARAMAMRCRWPPENSCGNRSAERAGSPTRSSNSQHPLAHVSRRSRFRW